MWVTKHYCQLAWGEFGIHKSFKTHDMYILALKKRCSFLPEHPRQLRPICRSSSKKITNKIICKTVGRGLPEILWQSYKENPLTLSYAGSGLGTYLRGGALRAPPLDLIKRAP